MNISVVIPTFNRQDFIKRAVESVLNQSFQPLEIIVVDDGSTDNTKEVLKDLNITYIYQKNSGVSSARNRGIEIAKAQWVCFLDSDDIWEEKKLEKQVEFHKKNSFLISQTEEKWIRNNKLINKPKHYKKHSGDIFQHSLQLCSITPSSVIIHKDIFKDIGVFDEELQVCEDYDLWLRITQKYPVGLIPEELVQKIAGHNNQLSFTTPTMDLYRLRALEKHLDVQGVREVYDKKKNILINGAKKHGNRDLLNLLIP